MKITKTSVRKLLCELGIATIILEHGAEKTQSKEGREVTVAEVVFNATEDVTFEKKEVMAVMDICVDLFSAGIPITHTNPAFHQSEEMTAFIKDLLEAHYEKQDAGQCDLVGNIFRMAKVLNN